MKKYTLHHKIYAWTHVILFGVSIRAWSTLQAKLEDAQEPQWDYSKKQDDLPKLSNQGKVREYKSERSIYVLMSAKAHGMM